MNSLSVVIILLVIFSIVGVVCIALHLTSSECDNDTCNDIVYREPPPTTDVISKQIDVSLFHSIQSFRRVLEYQTTKDFEQELAQSSYDLREYKDDLGNIYCPWTFSKTLVHSQDGLPTQPSVGSMLNAIYLGTEASLDGIQRDPSATRKLENVIGSKSFTLVGGDSAIQNLPPPPAIDAEGSVYEMMEVYAMSLVRDVAFSELELYESNHPILSSLNSFQDKTTSPLVDGKITGRTLFRSCAPGVTYGPHVSQLLYHDYKLGGLNVTQRYDVESDPVPHSGKTAYDAWLDCQRGRVSATHQVIGSKYIHTPRVLGSLVHKDPLYQLYQSAALVCFQRGISPVGYDNPNNSDWTSGGAPFILSTLATVSLAALKAAWHNKYHLHLRIRPEVYAQRIHLAYVHESKYGTQPGFKQIKECIDQRALQILQDVKSASVGGDNYLLNVLYPEQSPTHPSLVAGHAAVAGACVTVLKALLHTHDVNMQSLPWPLDVVHSVDGDTLVPYDAPTQSMTISGELNKLAANVSFGRNMAGVHYRCDGYTGMLLGEHVAHRFLQDARRSIHEANNGFLPIWSYESFTGDLKHVA